MYYIVTSISILLETYAGTWLCQRQFSLVSSSSIRYSLLFSLYCHKLQHSSGTLKCRRIWDTGVFSCLLNWLHLFKSDIIKMLMKREFLPGMIFIQVQNKRLFDNLASVWNKNKIKSDLYDQVV